MQPLALPAPPDDNDSESGKLDSDGIVASYSESNELVGSIPGSPYLGTTPRDSQLGGDTPPLSPNAGSPPISPRGVSDVEGEEAPSLLLHARVAAGARPNVAEEIPAEFPDHDNFG